MQTLAELSSGESEQGAGRNKMSHNHRSSPSPHPLGLSHGVLWPQRLIIKRTGRYSERRAEEIDQKVDRRERKTEESLFQTLVSAL